MKKIFIVITLSLILCGCGRDEPNKPDDAETISENEKISDLSENEGANPGNEEELGADGGEFVASAKKTYNIGDDTFDFVLGENDGEKRFYLYCNIKDKADAFYVHTSLNTLMNSEDENFKIIKEEFGFSYSIIVGDGTVLFRNPELLMITKDGAGIDVEDYFSAEWIASEEYHESDYGAQVMDFMIDFIENN